MPKKKVVIIGGGPAGIMAAIAASEKNNEVIVIEKNSVIGKKLSITGGGRCNVTNNSDPSDIMKNIMTNPKFLYRALNTFTSKDLIDIIERNGCPLKIEDKNRVFPLSDKSSDIIDVFNKIIRERQIKLYLECDVKDIILSNEKVKAVKTVNDNIINCDSVILATGGISYPHTGSTGTGHIIAKKLGHSIISLRPSLVSMNIKEKWLSNLMGISFEDIIIRTKIGKKSLSLNGDLLFTHYGISGPIVLELSAYLNKHDFLKASHNINIDFLPKLNYEDLKRIFISDANSNKTILNLLSEYMPKRFLIGLLAELNILQDTILHQLKKSDRNRIIDNIKNFDINIVSLRDINSAIITSGGISVKEIDPGTMESKKIKGLFFAGEIIDVDALTGGYNLQIAFSTGYLAGLNA
ncbi:MAG: NAD(P)/FAD-dependent oxidoreductase [Clostridiales bacterium]|nr:NAD(P)/FAD-dependent oxidoreductase [Clostridiales bacterium]